MALCRERGRRPARPPGALLTAEQIGDLVCRYDALAGLSAEEWRFLPAAREQMGETASANRADFERGEKRLERLLSGFIRRN